VHKEITLFVRVYTKGYCTLIGKLEEEKNSLHDKATLLPMSTHRYAYTSFIPQPGDPFLGVRTLLQMDETSDIVLVFRYRLIGFEERFVCSTRLLKACSDYFAQLLDLKDAFDTGLKQGGGGDDDMPVLTVDLPTREFTESWVISRIKCIICGVIRLRLESDNGILRHEEFYPNYHAHDTTCKHALDGCIMEDCSNFFMLNEAKSKLDHALEFGSISARLEYDADPQNNGSGGEPLNLSSIEC
jgi:hypothetical protein